MSRVTKPINITPSEGVKAKARELQQRDGYKSLTALVEDLIRQRHEEVFGRHGVAAGQEAINKAVESQLNESDVRYQADNPQNKTDDTIKPGAEKKKQAKKPQ